MWKPASLLIVGGWRNRPRAVRALPLPRCARQRRRGTQAGRAHATATKGRWSGRLGRSSMVTEAAPPSNTDGSTVRVAPPCAARVARQGSPKRFAQSRVAGGCTAVHATGSMRTRPCRGARELPVVATDSGFVGEHEPADPMCTHRGWRGAPPLRTLHGETARRRSLACRASRGKKPPESVHWHLWPDADVRP